MNTDLLTEDLKKARASNQSFWLMGQPDVEVRKRKDGRYEVEVHGFDYFDTAKGELVSGGKRQDRGVAARHGLRRALAVPAPGVLPHGRRQGRLGQAQEGHPGRAGRERLWASSTARCRCPSRRASNRKVAVKIVDDRGIESLKVIALPAESV